MVFTILSKGDVGKSKVVKETLMYEMVVDFFIRIN